MISFRIISSKLNLRNARQLCISKTFYCEKSSEQNVVQGGFAKAYEKFQDINAPIKEVPQTFASLLKNSKFVDVKFKYNCNILSKM